MDKKETKKFMERIKSHYQEFVIDEFKFSEWYGRLKDYDAEDVNKKFDEHLSSEVYGDSIPKIFFLTKYLTPTAEKGKIIHHTIICQLCGQGIHDTDYEKHFSRCSSASAIVRDMKKYYKTDVDYNQLMRMDEVAFGKAYTRYLNKMLNSDCPEVQKRAILHCLYPNMETESVADMLKGVVGK